MKASFSVLFFLLFFEFNITNAQRLVKIWETNCELKIPESVLFDAERNVIYVANINGDPSAKDGNGFISELFPDGNEKELQWVKRLNAPKGMAIFNTKLYVSDIDELVEIDIAKGKIIRKYKAENAAFLNDVTACLNGNIFVSDSQGAKIFMLNNGELKVWLEGKPFRTPNGLIAERGRLYVGDTNIYEIDILTQKIISVVENTGGVDGLEKNGKGDFIFSNWPGRVFIYQSNEIIKLLDSTAQDINAADIDYIQELDLLLVPTFFDNKIIAYKVIY